VAAKLIRFDGAYLRFTGELRIEHRSSDAVVESLVRVRRSPVRSTDGNERPGFCSGPGRGGDAWENAWG
jgi:hypothetical protein